MPQALPFIATAVAGKLGLGKLATLALTVGTSAAVASYETSRAKRAARNAYNASLQDRTITLRSGVAAWQYVLGTCRTSGALLYGDSVGTNRVALDTVTALAANRCELVGHYIAEEYVPVGDFPGLKYSKQQVVDRRTSLTVTGPSGSFTLPEVPRQPSDVRVFRLVAGRSVAVSASVSGTTVTYGGIPAGPQGLLVVYKAAVTAKMFFQFKDGSADQVVTSWNGGPSAAVIGSAVSMVLGQASPVPDTPLWTADHRARGICHLRTLYLWDADIYSERGAPQHGAVLRGLAVDGHPFFDPRTGENLTYTTNPIILAAWWDTLPMALGGCGTPFGLIDWDSVATEANVCDELIEVRTLDGTGYEFIKRYECNTLLSLDAAPRANLDVILGAANARRVFTAGKFRYKAGAFRPATITITDADIDGEASIQTGTGGDIQFAPNVVTASFSDATQNWTESSPSPVVNAAYLAADGVERPLDLQFPAVTDPRQVNYLMGVALESTRPMMTVSLTVLGIGEDIAYFDTVLLDVSNRPAYTGRTFEVVGRVDNGNGTFALDLAEIRPQTWSLNPDTWTPVDPVPVQNTTYRTDVAEPTGFAVSLITPQTLPDGTAVARVQLSWNPATQDLVRTDGRHELRYRRIADDTGGWNVVAAVSGQDVSTTVTVAVLDADTYVFQLRAVNALGAASPWADAFATVAGTPILDGGMSLAVASLSRPSAVLIAFADGSLPSGAFDSAAGQFILRSGAVDLIPAATLSVLSATNCTGTINTADSTPVAGQPKGFYRVTAVTADQASLVMRAVHAGQTFDLTFTVTRTRAGYQIVSGLPTDNLFEGRIVVNTADYKLYRYTGTAWTAEVPSTDIAGQITNAQIADLAAAKLTGQITSTQITDEAITTPKLAAGAVVAGNIAAYAVTAEKLFIGASSNGQSIFPDPFFYSPELWIGVGTPLPVFDGIGRVFSTGPGTPLAVRMLTANGYRIPDGRLYRVSAEFFREPGSGLGYIRHFSSSDGVFNPSNYNSGYLEAIETPVGGWHRVSATINTPGLFIWPEVHLGFLAATPGARMFMRNFRIEELVEGSLIVDGAITATKMAADSVTANSIQAGAIIAGKLAADSIVGVNIQASTITAGKFLTDAGVDLAAIVPGSLNTAATAFDSVESLISINGSVGKAQTGSVNARSQRIGFRANGLIRSDDSGTFFDNFTAVIIVQFRHNGGAWTSLTSRTVLGSNLTYAPFNIEAFFAGVAPSTGTVEFRLLFADGINSFDFSGFWVDEIDFEVFLTFVK